jgi:hypothetical protein
LQMSGRSLQSIPREAMFRDAAAAQCQNGSAAVNWRAIMLVRSWCQQDTARRRERASPIGRVTRLPVGAHVYPCSPASRGV